MGGPPWPVALAPQGCKASLLAVHEAYGCTVPRPHRGPHRPKGEPPVRHELGSQGHAKTALSVRRPVSGRRGREPSLHEIREDLPWADGQGEGITAPGWTAVEPPDLPGEGCPEDSAPYGCSTGTAAVAELPAEEAYFLDIVPGETPNTLFIGKSDQLVNTYDLPNGRVRLVFSRGATSGKEPATPSAPSTAGAGRRGGGGKASTSFSEAPAFGDAAETVAFAHKSEPGKSSTEVFCRRPASARISRGGPFLEAARNTGPRPPARQQKGGGHGDLEHFAEGALLQGAQQRRPASARCYRRAVRLQGQASAWQAPAQRSPQPASPPAQQSTWPRPASAPSVRRPPSAGRCPTAATDLKDCPRRPASAQVAREPLLLTESLAEALDRSLDGTMEPEGNASDALVWPNVRDWLASAQKCRAAAKAACRPYWGKRHQKWIKAALESTEPSLDDGTDAVRAAPTRCVVFRDVAHPRRPRRDSKSALRLYAALKQDASICAESLGPPADVPTAVSQDTAGLPPKAPPSQSGGTDRMARSDSLAIQDIIRAEPQQAAGPDASGSSELAVEGKEAPGGRLPSDDSSPAEEAEQSASNVAKGRRRPSSASGGEEDGGNAGTTVNRSRRMSTMAAREVTFWRLAHDGEVHRDVLCHALELCGVMSPVQAWVDDVFGTMSRYTTLDLSEFLCFTVAYEQRQDREYAKAFQRYDADGSGTIDTCELSALLASLGITPMDHVVSEILQEVDDDGSGKLDLQEFGRVMALLGTREGFAHDEYDRLMAAFRNFDADGSSSLDVAELTGVLGYLHYSVSREDALTIVEEIDVDGSGCLNGREFLLFMRRVRELEICRLQAVLSRLEEEGQSHSKETSLLVLIRGLGNFPDHQAVLEAAEDAGMDLPPEEEHRFHVIVKKETVSDKIGITVNKADLDTSDTLRVTKVDTGLVEDWNRAHSESQLRPGDDILEVNDVCKGARPLLDTITRDRSLKILVMRGKAKHAGPQLSLSEAWRFLEVHRSREGLTRAEASDLKAAFQQVADDGIDSNSIRTADAGRALRWLGHQSTAQVEEQLLGEVDVQGSGRLGLAQFQKLVRKYHERELGEIRRALLGLGIWREDTTVWIPSEQHEAAMRAVGCVDKEGNVTSKPCGTDLSGLVNQVLRQRAEVRRSARLHAGFAPRQVQELRAVFRAYDADHAGELRHAALRQLCEDYFPELATSMRNRPELIALLSKADAGGDGGIDFKDFLRLMREFTEIRKNDRRAKERRAMLACDFTSGQVREFREVFIAADVEERDCLSFEKVLQLLHRIAPLGGKRVDDLTRVWQQVVRMGTGDKSGENSDADFADFLLLMKHLLDTNFAGIKDRSVKTVH